MKYRIGLVGTGGIARNHYAGYSILLEDRVEVVAGCDPNKAGLEAFCDDRNIPLRFTGVDDLLQSGEIDVIVLLTPPAVREEYIFPALEKGIHILVEKPFGCSYAECRRYVKAAEGSTATLAVSQNLRFYPDIEWAHKVVSNDMLGKLTTITHDHYQWRMHVGGWRRDEERLEIAIFSIHIIDRMRWIAGLKPITISAVTRNSWQADAPRGEVFTDLRVEFEQGVVGRMTSSWYSREPLNRLCVDDRAATLITSRRSATAPKSNGVIIREDGRREEKEFFRENAVQKAFGYILKELLDAIEEKREPIHSGRDNLDTMTIVDGAYLSASRGGVPVTADEVQCR